MALNSIDERKTAAKFIGRNLNLSTAKIPSSTNFKEPFIRYLKENANGRQLLKLMKLNKWFIPSKFKLIQNNFRNFHPKDFAYSWDTDTVLIKSKNVGLFFQKSLYIESKNVRIFEADVNLIDLKYFISGGNVEHFCLYEVKVMNESGKIAMIDDIIDLTPKLRGLYLIGKSLYCVSGGIIAQKLLQTNLRCIRFMEIPESFDFQSFVDIIKEKPNVRVDLHFHESVSDEHVARIKAGCPFEYIESWYRWRILTPEQKIANERFVDRKNIF